MLTILVLGLMVLFCSVTHAGVVDLQFQNMNSTAYASADTSGGFYEMSDPYSAFASSFWEEFQPDLMIHSAFAEADISYSQGSDLIQSIDSSLSGAIEGMGATSSTNSSTFFSAELVIGTTQDIPTGTPLELLIDITISNFSDADTNFDIDITKSNIVIFELAQFINHSTSIAVNAGDELSINMVNDNSQFDDSNYTSGMLITFEVVPEPATISLLGLGSLFFTRKRR